MTVRQTAQGRGAVRQLALADDGGVFGAEGVCVANLRLQGALPGGDDGGDALTAEVGGEAERLRAGVGGLEGDEDARPWGLAYGEFLALEVQDYTLDAGGPADAGCGPAAELLD